MSIIFSNFKKKSQQSGLFCLVLSPRLPTGKPGKFKLSTVNFTNLEDFPGLFSPQTSRSAGKNGISTPVLEIFPDKTGPAEKPALSEVNMKGRKPLYAFCGYRALKCHIGSGTVTPSRLPCRDTPFSPGPQEQEKPSPWNGKNHCERPKTGRRGKCFLRDRGGKLRGRRRLGFPDLLGIPCRSGFCFCRGGHAQSRHRADGKSQNKYESQQVFPYPALHLFCSPFAEKMTLQ